MPEFEKRLSMNGWIICDKETGAEYKKFTGGLSCPTANKKGWLVVLSEDFNIDETLKKPHIRVLTEFENINPEPLITRAFEYCKAYPDCEFFTDLNNRAMTDFLHDFQQPFYPQSAPLCDDAHSFDFYIAKIRQLTEPGKKLLHFGNSKLPGLLNSLPGDVRTSNAKSQDFPGFLALSYALAGLDFYGIGGSVRDEMREAEEANAELEDLF